MKRQERVDETVSCKDMFVSEHGGEFAIDPVGRGSRRQGLMLRDPGTGQLVIMPSMVGRPATMESRGRRECASSWSTALNQHGQAIRSVALPLGLYAA
jgi:hypothetical protein